MSRIISMITCVLALCVSLLKSQTEFERYITDDCPVNFKILNLQNEVKISNNGPLKFTILKFSSPAKRYFKIQNQILYTSDIVDLDSMCSKVDECCTNSATRRDSFMRREPKTCTIELKISYMDSDVEMITVKIVIKDQNDHVPRFLKPEDQSESEKGNIVVPMRQKTLTIPEGTKIGFVVKLPRAIDYDYSSEDRLKYSILSFKPLQSQSIFELVDVNPSTLSRDKSILFTPALRIRGSLDREKNPMYTFILSASDNIQKPFKTGSVTMTILIQDVNDNLPKFKQDRYNVHKPEGDRYSRLPMLTLQAEDRDEGNNAVIEYVINPDRIYKDARRYFQVDKISGKVFQKAALDYERKDMIEFEVIARNTVPLVSVNSENSIYHKLSQTSTATIKVTVINRYDERLKIVVDYFNDANHTSVDENQDSRTLAFISVQNPDLSKLIIHCKIDDIWNHFFKLIKKDPKKYNYILKQYRKLDREKNPKVQIFVICSHLHPSSRKNIEVKKAITIHVNDQNDNSPKFKKIVQGSRVDVWENTRVGSVVCTITAEDPDEADNGKVLYSLSKSSSLVLEHMQINENTGYITIRKPLDREELRDSYMISDSFDDNEALIPVIVTAKDCGNPPLSSEMTFKVVVLDVNDNKPYFRLDSMYFKIKENMEPPVNVGTFQVIDLDINDTIKVEIWGQSPFKIVPVPSKDNNRVTREFEVHTTRKLDCEKKGQYDLIVRAYDRPRYAPRRDTNSNSQMRFDTPVSGKVQIEVEDVNDVAPVFKMPSSSNHSRFIISYQEPVGHRVFKVTAIDNDRTSQNSQLTCSVEVISYPNQKLYLLDDHTYTPILTVDQYNMDVTIVRSMSPQDIGSHRIRLTVSDNGVPSLHATAYATITVNKSPPRSSSFDNRKKPGTKLEEDAFNSKHKNDGSGFGDYNVIIIVIVIVFVLVIIVIFVLFFCIPKNCLHTNGTNRNNINASITKQQQQQHLFVNNHNKMMAVSSNETQFMNQPHMVTENMDAINSYPRNEDSKYMTAIPAGHHPKFSQPHLHQFGGPGNRSEYTKLNSPDLFPPQFYNQPLTSTDPNHQTNVIYQTIADLQPRDVNGSSPGMHSPSFSMDGGGNKRQRHPTTSYGYRTFEGIRDNNENSAAGAATFHPPQKRYHDEFQLVQPSFQSEQQLWQPSSNHQLHSNQKQEFLLDESCDPDNVKNQSDNLSCFINNNNLDGKSDIQGIQAFAKNKPQDESSFV